MEIRIIDLEVFAHHGVLRTEKQRGQKFLVCAVLQLPKVPTRDSLHQTVDYAAVCRRLTEWMTAQSFDLIETAADHLCRQLLVHYPLLVGCAVEIKKPDAPIGLPVSYVSTHAQRTRHTAFLGLGSNLGNREQNLKTALEQISALSGNSIFKISSILENKAYGNTNQPDFLNAVCMLSTILEPHELLDALHQIETALGRVRTERWGARTLDLDILFYDDLILSDPVLTVPHPDLHNRLFVLKPLCEIAPNHRHPVCQKRMTQLLEQCKG